MIDIASYIELYVNIHVYVYMCACGACVCVGGQAYPHRCTCRSSSVLSRAVSCPLLIRPGVSTMVTPLGSFIFKKSSVVPGMFDTVACGASVGQTKAEHTRQGQGKPERYLTLKGFEGHQKWSIINQ